MPTSTVDNKQYEYDTLTNEAKAQLASIKFVDSVLARLQVKAAALQTARIAYAKVLSEALPAIGSSNSLKL